MKVIEIFGNLEIDVRKVEITPWLVDENEIIDLIMCVIPKGASKEIIKAEFTFLMVDKYEEYDQIYTDEQTDDHSHGLS
jgi:hypothetical protein